MKYIDTHGHIFSQRLTKKESLEQLKRFKESDVEIVILPGTTEVDSLKNIEISDNKRIFAAIGVHPSEANNLEVTNFMEDFDYSKVIAIGECGLDYYYEDNPPKELQIQVFKKHLKIAKNNSLPVIIHCREAINDIYKILKNKEFKGLKFVMHSYSGGIEWIKKLNELDAYYSFNGITTFKNAKDHQETVKVIPLNRIIVETDSPYLAPVPHRGKVNEPIYLKYIANFVADIRPEENQVVLKSLWNNSLRLFNIKY